MHGLFSRFANSVLNSWLDRKVIWSHIKALRLEYLKKNSLLKCEYDNTLIQQILISSNLEKLSQVVGVSISDKIDNNFSKSDISESAKQFFALNSCPSFFVKLYWKAIYGPKERMAMLTSNILKKAKGDLKEVALKIFAKVSSVLGFQSLSYHHEVNDTVKRNIKLIKNIFDIKGEKL